MNDRQPKPQRKRSGSTKRRRYPRVYARVTPAEREQIKEAAAGLGLAVGAYLRDLALGERQQTRSVRRRQLPEREALDELKGQARKIGSNIAQILRRLNVSGIYPPEFPDTLRQLSQAAQGVMELAEVAKAALKGA